jgi:hypothetical protein
MDPCLLMFGHFCTHAYCMHLGVKDIWTFAPKQFMGELNQVQKREAQYYKISNTLILLIYKICPNFLQSHVVAYIILQCHEIHIQFNPNTLF